MKVSSVKNRKVTLFVKSIKTIIGTEETETRGLISGGPGLRPGSFRISPKYGIETVPKYEFVLPEDQGKIVEMVEEIVDKLGFDVEIIDTSRENTLRREIQREIKKIRTFPTLVVDSGEKVEGEISKEQIELLLSSQKARTKA
jgi:glutaredoxin